MSRALSRRGVEQPEGVAVVIVADISGSMSGKKFERLKAGLAELVESVPGCKILAFNDLAVWVEGPGSIPTPDGSTDLAQALEKANAAFPPRVVVISDGHPNNDVAALAAAERCPGQIDVRYIGPDDDRHAIAFMQRLAHMGGGQVVTGDLANDAAICGPVRAMLGLPAPIAL